ncbi:assimilatory sulfite reductase (NADPH) flavoprotein subunit [Oceanobacillus longus]|uniref:Assimilatory sulfite reductase (NADPH) flavoprotein subunit n=1 Tax=Oceanobacillus longus TaxID=930120 RepID=A0ABV8GXM5_9BACI
MQLNVMNSPFSQEQTENLNVLLPTLTEAQRNWLGGYLAAIQVTESIPNGETATNGIAVAAPPAVQIASREVTVLYGSETGTGQRLAEEAIGKLEGKNLKVKIAALDDFKTKDLKKVEDLLIISATHGEGEPPDNAISFYEFLHSRKAPKLTDVRFSVLSLGDQSYEFFCQTGKDFDKRLEELGGERLYPRVDCDLDFDEPAEEWIEGVLGVLNEAQESESSLAVQEAAGTILEERQVYTRTNPYMAEILDNLNLSGRGSNKENRHLELSLEGSNLVFEPGDSLGILPQNNPELVDQLIKEMKWNPDETVQVNKQGEIRSLREALLSNFEITRLTKPLLEQAAVLFDNEALHVLVQPGQEEARKVYIDGRDLLDLVKDYPPKSIAPSEFIQILRKIPARLYSIASSYKANPDEVQLTIGTVRYHAHGRDRAGVCTEQIAERIEPGELMPVYVHPNPNFKFPFDTETPVIMIGPGTGVAPYRSYLEELEEEDIKVKTWLFFGDQHFETDFLYQTEWQNWLNEGVLTKMDVAFSRDTAEKVYVQHRMLEKSKEVYQWLNEGAHVYVCGDEKHMATDVHATLTAILEQEGGFSHEEAEAYLGEMRKQKRYQRDVY